MALVDFSFSAYDFITAPEHYQLDRKQKEFLKHETFHGNEIVANTPSSLPDEYVFAQYR